MSDEQLSVKAQFSYSDIRFAESDDMFDRAAALFSAGKVVEFLEIRDGYSAVVQGTHPYRVRLNNKRFDYANCTCYMGQNDQLCKHMLALALHVLHINNLVDGKGKPIGTSVVSPEDSRQHINAGISKIRAYTGPSRIWFEYQRKLDVAAGMISEGAALLPTSADNAKLLWRTVLRISKKLSHGGVDDSNGTIGGAISNIIDRIAQMSSEDESIKTWAANHCTDDTGFGFEEELQVLLKAKK